MKTRIVVIDDDPDLCELIQDALANEYQVQTTTHADQAIALVNDLKPSIVILDINLPNGNGLHLCEEISKDNSPLVLLVSGDNTLDMRLEAYQHGGADFLAKPFRIQELRAKVETLNKLYQSQAQLRQSSEYATKTAMNAMAEASQYGEVLRFYNDMYKAMSIEEVKASFFSLMETFGLQSSIQFRLKETLTFDYLDDECNPIEIQIYENLTESDRIIPFSNRMMVNGMFASFIVKNMPTHDDVENGRLRDILATLIEGLDAKLLDLQRLGLLRQTSRELAMSSQRLATVVKDHEEHLTGAMNHVVSSINASFHTLELTEAQESFFTKLTERVLNSMEDSFVCIGNETDVLDCLRLSLSVVLNDKEK